MRTLAIFILCILALNLISCGTTVKSLTPAQQEYQRTLAQERFTFRLPKSESDNAWGRAQVFIAKYSSMKLQITTDNVLETYNPTGYTVLFGYKANRINIGDSTEFSLDCMYSNSFTSQDAVDNGRIFARYVRTGNLEHPEMIVK